MKKVIQLPVVALVCAVAFAACSNKAVKTEMPDDAVSEAPAQSSVYTPEDLDTDACLRQRVIYFDFDKSSVKPEFDEIMACHAQYLQDRPSAHVRLEGNTDERGSRNYNLGLGENRSNAAASALEAYGASTSQMDLISYGEERPVCDSHDEGCWSQNRRVEIIYTAK